MPPTKQVVSPGSDQQALQQRIDAAKGPKVPVGGVPMPAVPRFDQVKSPDRSAGAQNFPILSPEERAKLAEQGRLRPGVGSAYSANQPAQQAKTAPSPDQEASAGIRPETIQQLEDVAKYNLEEAARVEEAKKEEASAALDAVESEADLGFEGLTEQRAEIEENKKRKEAIESRCAPLALSDLLVHQELRQVVPIVVGVYEPTFRTISGDEDLFIKSLMSREKDVSTQFFMDKYSAFQLCAGLYALNGHVIGDQYIDKDGNIDEKAFMARFKKLVKYPWTILVDLSANYVWFNQRVRKLMVVDAIKGF